MQQQRQEARRRFRMRENWNEATFYVQLVVEIPAMVEHRAADTRTLDRQCALLLHSGH